MVRMLRRSIVWGLSPAVAWTVGCAGAALPGSAAQPIEVAHLAEIEPEPQALASAPTRPETLVASVRLSGRARLDASDIAWARPLARLTKDATHRIPQELLGLLDSDAPIDIAIGSEARLLRVPRLVSVVSAGLRSLEGGLAALRGAGESVDPLGDGRFRVTTHRGECVIAPSSGPAEARIVCARRAAHLERMSGWLIAELASQPMPVGVDLLATLYGDGARRAFAAPMLAVRTMGPQLIADELRRESPLIADMLEPLVPAVLDEGMALLDDIDELTARVTGDATQLRISLDVTLRSTNAWTSRALQDTSNEPIEVPAIFWRMPKDAHTAWFVGTQGPHTSLEHLRAEFAHAGGAALKHVDPSLQALMAESFIPPGTFAYASGFSSERLAVAPGPSEAAWIRREVVARFGWHIAAVNDPIARYADYLDKAVDTYNRGPIQNLAYGGISALCVGMPKITRHPLKRPKMPSGAFEYEMAIPGTFFDRCAGGHLKAGPAKPMRGVIVVIPDGDTAMVGLSLDPPTLYARMETALQSPPKETESLTVHPSLSALLEPPPFAGGFVTLSGLAMMESNLDSTRYGRYASEELVVRTRNRADGGSTPIPIAWSALGGSQPTLRATLVLPRAAFD